MPSSYEQFLEQIAEATQKYGGRLQPPCDPEILTDLQHRAREALGGEVPSGYLDFLRRHDGFDWDGLIFYASRTVPIAGRDDRFIEGFVEANLGWHDSERKKPFLVFGDSGLDLYVYEPASNEYSARDRVSLDKNESYPSFEDMLAAALRSVS